MWTALPRRGQSRLRRSHGDIHPGKRGQGGRHQVSDLRLRLGHCRLQHGHGDGQGNEPGGGHEDNPG